MGSANSGTLLTALASSLAFAEAISFAIWSDALLDVLRSRLAVIAGSSGEPNTLNSTCNSGENEQA